MDSEGILTANTIRSCQHERAQCRARTQQQMRICSFGHACDECTHAHVCDVAREALATYLHTSVNWMNLQADKSWRDVEFQVGQQLLLYII